MELAGRLYYYAGLDLKTPTSAKCSCPVAEAKLLTRSVLPLVNNPTASPEPSLLQGAQQTRAANALELALPNLNIRK